MKQIECIECGSNNLKTTEPIGLYSYWADEYMECLDCGCDDYFVYETEPPGEEDG